MAVFRTRDGGGGGLRMRTPPDRFAGASVAAGNNARDAAIAAGSGDLAQFDADPNLVVEITNTGPDPDQIRFQARRGNAWVDVTNVVSVQGPRGLPGAGAATPVLEAFLANSAGAQQGAVEEYPATADFQVFYRTSAAARRVGFLVPAGRVLVAVYSGARNVTNRFPANPADNARRRVYDRDLSANRDYAYRIRTRAT